MHLSPGFRFRCTREPGLPVITASSELMRGAESFWKPSKYSILKDPSYRGRSILQVRSVFSAWLQVFPFSLFEKHSAYFQHKQVPPSVLCAALSPTEEG